MRRDIAALWIAFNQHERSLRDLAGRLEASLGALAPPLSPDDAASRGEEADGKGSGRSEPQGSPPAAGDEISDQLADLDDVLAAIERATQVLEHTHADELEREGEPDREDPAGD